MQVTVGGPDASAGSSALGVLISALAWLLFGLFFGAGWILIHWLVDRLG